MEPTHDPRPGAGTWSLTSRLLFRFGLLFRLYSHPFPLNYIPNPATFAAVFEWDWAWTSFTKEWVFDYISEYSKWIREHEFALIDWTANTVFGVSQELDRPFGSGDPTHSYVRVFVHAVLAAAGCLVWTVAGIRWRSHRLLGAWWLIGLRFYLAFIMLGYGFAKVFPNQFRFPSLGRLVAEYGDSSPMNVLWSFMGSSEAYTIFAGAGELLGGVLLLFRRTATLGALVTIGVMTNVVAMNFCYDVPVKLYSSHIVLFACFLCVPDLRRLIGVLVLNRPTLPRDIRTPYLPVVGSLVMVLVVGTAVTGMVASNYSRFAERPDKPELYGIWDVKRYAAGGEEVPPLTTDPVRWQNLLVESERSCVVRGMDGARYNQGLQLAEDGKSLTISSGSRWRYRQEDPDTLMLEGEFMRFFVRQPREPVSAENPSLPREPQLAIRLRRRRADVEAVDASHRKETAETQMPVGTWEVVETEILGEFHTPRRRTDPSGFKVLVIQPGGEEALVVQGNDRVDQYTVRVDPKNSSLRLSSRATLTIERPSPEELILRGQHRGHDLDIKLERRDLKDYMLVRRGFNWINEIPFNRY